MILQNKPIHIKSEVLAFFTFTAAAIMATWPVAIRLKSGLFAGLPSDAGSAVWYLWWQKTAWMQGVKIAYSSIAHAPFGSIVGPRDPLYFLIALPLSLIAGETIAYNVITLTGFILSGMMMYLLVRRVTEHDLAAIFAGITFMLAPYHLAQAYIQIALGQIQWLPLYFYLLINFLERRSSANAFYLGIGAALVSWGNFYYALMLLIVTIVIMAYILIRELLSTSEERSQTSKFGFILITLAVAATLVGPLLFLSVSPGRGIPAPKTALWEVAAASMEAGNYLLPAPDNPLFGHFVENYFYSRTNFQYPVGDINFLGYLPLMLASLAIIHYASKKRRKDSQNINRVIMIMVITGLTALVFAAPPIVKIFGHEIALPAFYLHEIATMFRALGRFGVIISLAVSILAGIGAKCLLSRYPTRKQQLVIFAVLTALTIVEFINVPPWKVSGAGEADIPPAYSWIARQPGDFNVVEYPLSSPAWTDFHQYTYSQRFHGKGLAAVKEIPGIEGSDCLSDPNNAQVNSVLKYLGVKYVMIHSDTYRSIGGSFPEIGADAGLKLAKSFPNTLVYKVETDPSPIFWAAKDNFFSPDFWGGWDDYGKWRWMTTDAKLEAINCGGRGIYRDFYFHAAALGYPRELEVRINGDLRGILKVMPDEKMLKIEDVFLKAGLNVIIFKTDSSPEQITNFLTNDDTRSATFRLTGFEVR